jgi:hypothetical protein
MKHLAKSALILCATLLCICSGFARNRIANVDDQKIYGEYITPGDLIIDTPTKVTSEGSELIYYFMQKQWPGLREGGTIWLDGKKLGYLHVIKFCNTASPLTAWHIQSARFRNIPDTQVRATSFFCQGLKNFELDGESASYPGLSQWPESRKFLTGSFGFHIISKLLGGHGLNIAVLDGGTIKLNGFEAQHGFTPLRINGGDYDLVVKEIEITNFYIHDTGDGEGMYLGATHPPPYAKLQNLKIHDGIITRTAAEGMQLQHLAGGADIHHITIRSANVRWMNEFRAGQDTGIQWSIDCGDNKLHHVIVDGFASVGLVPFGNPSNTPGGKSEVSDVLFNDGIDTGIYLHKSGSYGIEWTFKNLYYRSFKNSCYYEGTGRPERKFIVSSRNGTDNYIFKNIVHDGSKPAVFQETEKKKISVESVSYKNLSPVIYRNSGFYEPASKIKQWSQYYAKYFPASKAGAMRIPTDWQAGDIAIETEGEYAFYKCLVGHTATDLGPSKNPYFVKLTWDENGIRSDQKNWDASTQQSLFPPDDLRLMPETQWEYSGLGFPEREAVLVLKK